MKGKKIIAALLALCLCIGVFSACTGDDDVEPGATIINVWLRDFEDWSNNYMESALKGFNSNMEDGYHIKYRFIPDEEFGDTLKAAQDNNSAPDIYQVAYLNLYSELQKKTIAPLNDLLSQSNFDDLKDIAKELVYYDDTYWAYPMVIEPGAVLYYRKDLLAQANVTSNPSSWTFADLYAASAKLKGTMGRGKYAMSMFSGTEIGWASLGLQSNLNNGGLAISKDWATPTVNTNGYKELNKMFYEMYQNGYVPLQNFTSYNDQIIDLCGGKVAMCYTGSWAVAEIMQTYPDMVDKIGVAPIATLDGDKTKTTATNGGWSFVVDAKSRVKAAAAKVLEYLVSDNVEVSAGYFEAAAYSKTITRKSVQALVDSRGLGEVPKVWIDVIDDIAVKAIPESIYPWDINTAIIKMAEAMAIYGADDDSRNQAALNTEIARLIAEAEATITQIINRDSLAGKNPHIAAN